jgi:hypothetical protein
MPIVGTFFAEIERGGIPESMRKNMLMSNEVTSPEKGHKAIYTCLFFRASNLIAFFRGAPHLFELLNISGIRTAESLLLSLKKAGVLAFAGKAKERGIPVDPKLPLKTRRVSHLVALDLLILEQNYGIVMPKINRLHLLVRTNRADQLRNKAH